MRWGLPKTEESLGQHFRGGTRWGAGTSVRTLDVATTFFSRLPRLITVHVEEKEAYFARGMLPLM